MHHVNRVIDRALESLRPWYGTTPEGGEFAQFMREFAAVFNKPIPYEAFLGSVMTMAGQEVSRDSIQATAWRLAANLNRLLKGRPVPPWLGQTEAEWVLIDVVRAKPGRTAKGKPGHTYDYRVLNGLPAGLRFNTFRSKKQARFIAKSIGFSKFSRMRLAFRDGMELVGMKMYVLLDPELSTPDGPGFYHFHATGSCKAANRELMKMRRRVIPCPEGFSLAEVACPRCPYGYDHCPAGCHPATYVTKMCPRCLTTTAWYDPTSPCVVCVDCEEKDYHGLS